MAPRDIELSKSHSQDIELQDIELEDKHDPSDGYCPKELPVGDVMCCCRKGVITSPLDVFYVPANWFKTNKTQILSGITVSLAQVPEAISFSFVAGVDPIVGLHSAWIMGIVTSLVGGRPGMVAGATGAVAVILPNLVKTYGVGHMFYAIMLAGIIQMLFGLCKCSVIIRMIPHPVMVGFCNGLGIVIGAAQFGIFKVVPEGHTDSGHRGLSQMFGAFSSFTNGHPWINSVDGAWMIFQVFVTLATYIIFPKIMKCINPKLENVIPGSLAGIIVSTIVEWAFIRNIGFKTNTVSDLAAVSGSFPLPVWFDSKNGYDALMPPLNLTTLSEIFPTAITAAAIGLLESLLTLQLIDELTNTKGNGNREAFGQGMGQFLSAIFGGMGGCTTIGQSLMNIHSGGYTRLSSSVAAIFMLLIIVVAYPVVNAIPVSSLAGVMFIITYFTIEWESGWVVLASCLPENLRERYGITTKVKRADVYIMLVVVAVTLVLDLAIAVGVGILIAALIFVWDSGEKLKVDRTLSEDGTQVLYTVHGPIFFGSIKPLMEMFPNPKTEPREVTVLLENAEIYDWSGMVAIKSLHERFELNDIKVTFQKLNVSSHKLMMKGKKLWEGVDILEEQELDFEDDPHISSHQHLHVMDQH